MKFNMYLGSAVSAWVLAVMVIVTEFSETFKTILTLIFSHHWIAKGIITLIVFLVFSYILRNKKTCWKCSDEKTGWYSIIGSIIIIFLFYLIKFFI